MRIVSSFSVLVAVVAVVTLCGCRTPKGENVQEKRAYSLSMRDQALADLYEARPEARAHVEGAPAYGVFSNIGSKIFFLATGNGFGVVVNNETGEKTYMKMLEAGGGVGLGLKTYRAVYVFNSKDAFETFITSGWQAAGDADAAAKIGETGLAAGAALTTDELTQPVTVYQFTDSGIALSATATGTKYYKDDELNQP